MRYRIAALVASLLATAAATLAMSPPALAAAKDVQLKLTQPSTFVAGGNPGTFSATASTDGSRPGCRKVRWVLVIRVQGVQLNQVRVTRLEGPGEFPVNVQTAGDTARIVDQQLDTGSLCPSKTATAAYAIAITGSGTGAIAFRSEPRDAAGRLLSTATSESTISKKQAVAPLPPSPSASPSPSPSESDAAVAPPVDPPPTTAPALAALTPAAGKTKDNSPSLLGPGLIIGGLLVFAGVAILLRLRLRSRGRPRGLPPTSFYPTYPSR